MFPGLISDLVASTFAALDLVIPVRSPKTFVYSFVLFGCFWFLFNIKEIKIPSLTRIEFGIACSDVRSKKSHIVINILNRVLPSNGCDEFEGTRSKSKSSWKANVSLTQQCDFFIISGQNCMFYIYIYIYVYINYPSYILYHPRSRRDLMGRFAYPTSFQQPSLILSIPCWLFSSRKPRVLTITMFFKKQLIWRSRGPPTRTKTHGPIRNRQWNNYHQYLHVQVTRDVFFHQPIWSKNMRKSNRITLPKDRDKTYASCQAPPQCKWILSTEATFPLPRNFRGSISFSPREIFFFTVKGQVEVTSPKKSCEPKSFIFFGGGFKNC